MLKRVPLVNWDKVGYPASRINDLRCGQAAGVGGLSSLDADVEGWNLEIFKEDVHHLLSIMRSIAWNFCEVGWLLVGLHAELFVIAVLPTFDHVWPVCDYP